MILTKNNVDIKEGFKRTKLGLIPKDWDIIYFNEIADKQIKWSLTGGPFGSDLKSEHYTEEGIRVIQLQNLGDGVFIQKGFVYTSKKKADSLLACNIYPNEIILAKMGDPVTRACLIPNNSDGRYLMGSDGIRLVPDDSKFDRFFVKEYINFSIFRNLAMRHSTGSTRQRIGLTDLKKLLFIKPPLEEQQKIASILSDWDETIEKTQTLIQKLELRKKGLMQQLLTGKTRLAGFRGEWKEKKLGNYFLERKDTGFDNLELLSVGKDGVYPQDNSEKKDTSNSDKSKYKRICIGDIGYNTMRMWQGRSALSSMEGIVSPAYTILKPKENADSVFFSYLFKLEEMIHKFYRNSQGMVSDTWMCKFKDLSIIKFNAPSSKEEQTAIAYILKTADKEIEEQQKYLEQLQIQKKGLMQKLLTGKIRVYAPNEK